MSQHNDESTPDSEQLPDPETLLDDAELVIYSSSLDEIECDPDLIPDPLADAGVCSVSVWARLPESNAEIPLWMQSPAPSWLSLSQDVFTGDDGDRFSQTLIDAVASMVDPDAGSWGSIPETIREELTDLEWIIITNVNRSLIEMHPPEAMEVTDWCVTRSAFGPDTETDG